MTTNEKTSMIDTPELTRLLNPDFVEMERRRTIEDAIVHELSQYQKLEELTKKVAEQKETLAKQKLAIAEQKAAIAKKEATMSGDKASDAQREADIAQKEADTAVNDAIIASKDATIAEKNVIIIKLQSELELQKLRKEEIYYLQHPELERSSCKK